MPRFALITLAAVISICLALSVAGRAYDLRQAEARAQVQAEHARAQAIEDAAITARTLARLRP